MHNESELFRLKQQYNSLMPPDELNERVRAAMKRASQKPSFNFGRFIIRAGIGIAAVFTALFALVNLSPQTASAMSNVPVLGPIARFLTIDKYEDSQYGVEADIEIPSMQGMDNEKAQSNLNAAVNEYISGLIAEHKEAVDAAKEFSETDPELYKESMTAHQSLSTTCSVITDDKELFCIRLDTLMVMASGQQMQKHFTVDKTTGEVLSLGDLFTDPDAAVTRLKAIVLDIMNRRMAEDEGEMYFTEDLDAALTAEHDFYITPEGKLVLPFDEYEVAPGSMGAVEFDIPTEAIADIANGTLIK